jgi:adenine deaminase
MSEKRDVARILAVARGDAPADCVFSGGRVLSVFTREWIDADVAVVDGVIAGVGGYAGIERVDLSGRYVVPGFIDAHMHFETTRLLPGEYAREVLPQGTTCVVADPHEIANVLGAEGVRWFVDSCGGLQLDVYFMAPSSVPASPLESPRHTLDLADLEAVLAHERVLGLAEMMNFPGVIAGDEHELAKLRLAGAEHVDGHAPGVVGKDLAAYAAAGISSDHEAFTVEEGRDRLRAGMWLLIREASPARNLDVLLPLLQEFGPSRIAFCTDDREPDDLAADGHINGMVRRAVAAGIPVEDAVAAATLSPAACHGLRHLGAVAPGYQADLLVLDDLARFEPSLVVKRGAPVLDIPRSEVPDWVQQSVRIGSVGRDAFRVASDGGDIRVIGLVPEQIVTESLVLPPTIERGHAVADPSRDLAKIAVVERHHATGRVGLGFVRHSGLRHGAIASTVAHDAHNVVVIGSSDDDMHAAVARLVELGGGIVAVRDGDVLAECELPVAGLLSRRPAHEVIAQSRRCTEAAHELGWTSAAPFMTLSFLALSVVPALKITDRGLVDVVRGAVVPLVAAGA